MGNFGGGVWACTGYIYTRWVQLAKRVIKQSRRKKGYQVNTIVVATSRYGVAMRKQNYVQINKCGTNAADWAAGLYYSLNFIVATYSHELPCV